LIHRAHAVCFCTLVTILDLLLMFLENLTFIIVSKTCFVP
jgi:hypothetical protein